MVQLSEEQVDKVLPYIQQQKEFRSELEKELLDHFCCYIEECLTKGQSFEESLEQAYRSITPNGVADIEEEIEIIFNYKPNTKMKRILYLAGFISMFCFSMSQLARHWRWEEGFSMLILIGNLSLLFFVLPAISTMAFKNRAILNLTDKIRMLIGILSGMAVSIGLLFKFFHFPMANLLFTSGILVFCFLFLPIFFYQLHQRAHI